MQTLNERIPLVDGTAPGSMSAHARGRRFSLLTPFVCGSLLVLFVFMLPLTRTLRYSTYMNMGDEGAEAYASDLINHGARMLRDIPYQYGPLMPYYRALAFHALGTSLWTMRFSWLIVELGVYLLLYWLLAKLTRPAWALLICLLSATATGHWGFPRYEYNHVGCLLLTFAALALLWEYLKPQASPRRWQILLASLCLGGALDVKLNMGLAFTGAIVVWLALLAWADACGRSPDERGRELKRRLAAAALLAGLAAVLAAPLYAWCLHGTQVPLTRFFPYKATETPHTRLDLEGLHYIVTCARFEVVGTRSLGSNTIFLLWLATALPALLLFLRDRQNPLARAVLLFVLLATAGSHEHLLNAGSWNMFPWNYMPTVIYLGLAVWWLIQPAFRSGGGWQVHGARAVAAVVLVGCLGCIGASAVQQYRLPTTRQWAELPTQRSGVLYPRANVDYGPMTQALAFVSARCQPGEAIAALPYMPLLAFLSGHRLATTEYMFVEMTDVEPGLQALMIRELRERQPCYLFLSNFCWTSVPLAGGYFGVTYGRELAQVIRQDYEPVQTFGTGAFYGGWDRGQHLIRVYHLRHRG